MSNTKSAPTEAERRAAHQQRMRMFRLTQKLAKLCRQCQKPAVVLDDGTVMTTCDDHREADRARKKKDRGSK